MQITLSKEVGRVDVTVLCLEGQLDGQTYQGSMELDMVGFGNAFEIFTDLDKAVKSF